MISKPKPKRRKKSNRKLLEVRADRLVKTITLTRDSFCVCAAPSHGHSDVLQPGHLISRTKKSVRWDLRNVHCQCSSCNMLHEYAPERFTSWYLNCFGQAEYSRLVLDSQKTIKMSIDDLEKLCDELEAIVIVQQAVKDWKMPYFTQSEIVSGEWMLWKPVMK